MTLLIVGIMIIAVVPYVYLISLPISLEHKLKNYAKKYVYIEKAYNTAKESWYDNDEKVVWIARKGDIFNNIYVYLAAIHIESGKTFEEILGIIKAGRIAKWILRK